MEIKIAKSAGFCFGAKKAVDTVYECCGKGKPVYTLGPIIHNEIVVDDLKKHGAVPIESIEELENIRDAYVVIRSHGVEKETFERLESIGEKNNLTIADATCPFVKKIYRYVEEASAQGRHVLIAGDKDHPELKGIESRCSGKVTILEDPENIDVSALDPGEKYTIV
ncbi:MAG: 4-hydroxy-3-methylbut-2-enyl diphosphate reductase, partial [Lachnospiraceae bacterium]|nr:4-hydroxy-3-methylbut-2-enyl diphosphate reductase [Lachnospiraceae bacterium]